MLILGLLKTSCGKTSLGWAKKTNMKTIIKTLQLVVILLTGTFFSAGSHAEGILYDWTAICITNSAYSGQGTITIDNADFAVTQITGMIGGNTPILSEVSEKRTGG